LEYPPFLCDPALLLFVQSDLTQEEMEEAVKVHTDGILSSVSFHTTSELEVSSSSGQGEDETVSEISLDDDDHVLHDNKRNPQLQRLSSESEESRLVRYVISKFIGRKERE
jgi:hypothetical protein